MSTIQSEHSDVPSSQCDGPMPLAARVKAIGNGKVLGLSILVGTLFMLAVVTYERFTQAPEVVAKQLTRDVWVTEQVTLQSVPSLAGSYLTVIDMRPDSEADDEPSSSAMGNAVKDHHMAFAYVPVPHGDIPDAAVAALAEQLAKAKGPTLLYCRSGRRAARTWALVEASRPGGMDAANIEATVKASGQSADDLDSAIQLRISRRPHVTGA